MLEPANCAAVIPCLDEAASIAPLVAAVRRWLPLVVVVDDGSTDGTAHLAKDAGAVVVRHERNLGKGAALKTGLSRALERGCEWAVTLDGDGQHSPEDLPALLRCAGKTGAALVVGSRMDEAEKIPWLRRRVNRWMSRQLSRRAGRHLPDTQSGYRLVHLRTWAALSLTAKHFEVESEMLMAFLAARRRVEFVPIRVVRGSRSSHIHPVADSLRWWRWWRNSGRLPAAGSTVADALAAAARAEMSRQCPVETGEKAAKGWMRGKHGIHSVGSNLFHRTIYL
jgi:glycosyltransferase involved in cell wall biosynthesis